MKKILPSLLLFCICQFILCQNIIIKDVDILPMTSKKVLKKQSILIKNGRIKKIGKFSSMKNNAETEVINAKGKYLMPGLADMHAHLPQVNELDNFLEKNVIAGVTHLRVMYSEDSLKHVKKRITNLKELTPKLHYSYKITRNDFNTKVQWDSIVLNIKNNGEFIKLFSIPNEVSFDNIMTAANKHNVTVCGHYPAYIKDEEKVYIDIKKVLNSKYRSIEHLSGYNKNNIELAVKLTKKNTIFNCPTLDWFIINYNLLYPDNFKDRLTYSKASDALIAKWNKQLNEKILESGGKNKALELKEEATTTFLEKTEILKKLYKNNCLLLIGSDAGNPFQNDGFNIYEEMKNWSNLGIDNYTILKSATITPALFFKQHKTWGTVEVGKNADLIILNKNPLENIDNISTVETTIIGGKIYTN